MAFAEVNAFKFADKVTTYFQCAVSTCMRSEGMCEGRTVSFYEILQRFTITVSNMQIQFHFADCELYSQNLFPKRKIFLEVIEIVAKCLLT